MHARPRDQRVLHRRPSALIGGFIFVSVFLAVWGAAYSAEVLPGVEVLVAEHAAELKGKRVGILTNPTGVDRRLVSTVDLVRALPEVKVVRLFAPEHGVRGGYAAGEKVDEQRDPVSGIPIASLYGATRKPTPEMLADLDVVLYDIQDVGNRTYTFVSSLTYMMEACKKADVAVWVLDRPDPMGGNAVGGPMIDEENLSFIGIHPVAQVYGMTPGEWGRMIKAERAPGVEYRVIQMKGWRRGMTYGELGWIWIPPSPHIPRWETSYFYSMTGSIGELGRVNNGVGTPLPFEIVGAPWMEGVKLANAMNRMDLPGVVFRPITFAPRYAKFNGEMCLGVQIHLVDPREADSPRLALALMEELARLHPEQNLYKTDESKGASMFRKSIGDAKAAARLAANKDLSSEAERMQKELAAFIERRKNYLIYP